MKRIFIVGVLVFVTYLSACQNEKVSNRKGGNERNKYEIRLNLDPYVQRLRTLQAYIDYIENYWKINQV